ncbi:hypothetical protein DN594_24360 [Enterobacter cloacae]|nr:hypothetical protein DN594_24360 [Enterobacter cloacae]
MFVGVFPQPAGVAQRIPGPADNRDDRERDAAPVTGGGEARQALAQLGKIDADKPAENRVMLPTY